MKYIRGFLALAMLVMSVIGTSVYLEGQSFETPRSYVHKIYQLREDGSKGGSGSAVMVAPGMALTAAHVAVNDNLHILGKPTKTIKIDEERDIALVSVDLPCPCAPLGSMPNLDDRVVAVGQPLGEAEFATEGAVQGWDVARIWSSTPIAPGNSGGGLFAFQYGKWKLVGVTVEVAGLNLGFIGIPVITMTRSVDVETIKRFIGYDLE
jgi:S1-C subfamily serine protease